VLFEVPSVRSGLEQLERLARVPEGVARRGGGLAVSGMLLASSDHSVRGFPDPDADPDHWLERVLNLDASGARIIGGGAGTTEAHTAALARALGSLHPSLPLSADSSAQDVK
jgi:5-methyltetrahydrofolate--homocysteine methyltransferase